MAQTDNRLSADTVRALAAQYDDWDPESVVRIAWRESNFVPTVIADDSDDLSYGLMQLNMKEGTADIARLRQMFGITRNEELLNPVTNMRAAHVLWLASGKSFIPSWKFVPPVVNYPTSGGSTVIPGTDDQGNSTALSESELAELGNWMDTYTSNLIGDADIAFVSFESMSVRLQKDTVREFLADDEVDIPPEIRTLMERFVAAQHEPGIIDNISGIPGDIVGSITPWADGLSKVLSTLASLSFWKKVGVGAIALLFIIGAVATFNKDSILPVITKGAIGGKQ